MSVEKPSLRRVFSDTSRIITTNSLHFLSLSLLFIFPISLFNVIHGHTSTVQPSPSSPSHYRRLLSTVSSHDFDSQIPAFDKSQIQSQLLYALLLLFFNLCSVSAITHSIFHGFHAKPIKFSSSLKSIFSSFFPLLATKVICVAIMSAVTVAFVICMGLAFLGLTLLGFKIEPSSKTLMAAAFLMMILLLAVLVYLATGWLVIEPVVVVEAKHGFAPLERSASLVKGTRRVALAMMLSFSIMQAILSGLYVSLGGGGGGKSGGGVVVQMVAFAGFSTVLSFFSLATNTVFFIHCKEFKGEFEVESDEKLSLSKAFDGKSEVQSVDKMGQVYVQLPLNVAEHV